MSIAEFQRAFADLVAHPERVVGVREGDAAVLAGYALSPREHERLKRLARDEGMSVNCSLYRVNRLIPVYSVLPHTCRLLGDRLMTELDGFWAASRHATLQYRWEAWRFGLWLQERIAAGQLTSGPVEDAVRLELALFDAQAASGSEGRRRLVRLRHDPAALLDPDMPAASLQPMPGEIGVLVDATTRPASLHVLMD